MNGPQLIAKAIAAAPAGPLVTPQSFQGRDMMESAPKTFAYRNDKSGVIAFCEKGRRDAFWLSGDRGTRFQEVRLSLSSTFGASNFVMAMSSGRELRGQFRLVGPDVSFDMSILKNGDQMGLVWDERGHVTLGMVPFKDAVSPEAYFFSMPDYYRITNVMHLENGGRVAIGVSDGRYTVSENGAANALVGRYWDPNGSSVIQFVPDYNEFSRLVTMPRVWGGKQVYTPLVSVSDGKRVLESSLASLALTASGRIVSGGNGFREGQDVGDVLLSLLKTKKGLINPLES